MRWDYFRNVDALFKFSNFLSCEICINFSNPSACHTGVSILFNPFQKLKKFRNFSQNCLILKLMSNFMFQKTVCIYVSPLSCRMSTNGSAKSHKFEINIYGKHMWICIWGNTHLCSFGKNIWFKIIFKICSFTHIVIRLTRI